MQDGRSAWFEKRSPTRESVSPRRYANTIVIISFMLSRQPPAASRQPPAASRQRQRQPPALQRLFASRNIASIFIHMALGHLRSRRRT